MEYAGASNAVVERSTIIKASWRILPLLGLGYLVAYLDRANISFAATQMTSALEKRPISAERPAWARSCSQYRFANDRFRDQVSGRGMTHWGRKQRRSEGQG